MSLQLLRSAVPAHRSFAQVLTKLEVYTHLTGKTLDECIIEALTDYVSVVVEAKISQIEKSTQGVAV